MKLEWIDRRERIFPASKFGSRGQLAARPGKEKKKIEQAC